MQKQHKTMIKLCVSLEKPAPSFPRKAAGVPTRSLRPAKGSEKPIL
jgi:hypothetical protein